MATFKFTSDYSVSMIFYKLEDARAAAEKIAEQQELSCYPHVVSPGRWAVSAHNRDGVFVGLLHKDQEQTMSEKSLPPWLTPPKVSAGEASAQLLHLGETIKNLVDLVELEKRARIRLENKVDAIVAATPEARPAIARSYRRADDGSTRRDWVLTFNLKNVTDRQLNDFVTDATRGYDVDVCRVEQQKDATHDS